MKAAFIAAGLLIALLTGCRVKPTPSAAVPQSPAGDCQLPNVRCVGQGREYTTIQAAVNASVAGDVIAVDAGTYAGFHLNSGGTADAPIRVRANGDVTINAAEPGGSGEFVRVCDASHVIIEGFTIDASSGAGDAMALTARCATPTEPMHDVTFLDNTVFNAGSVNIYASEVADSRLEGNVAYGSRNSHGMYVSNGGSDNVVVKHNRLHDNKVNGLHLNGDASVGGDGIQTNVTVDGNTVWANGANGFDFDGVQGSRIVNNVVYGNGTNALRAFKIDGRRGPRGLVIASNVLLSDHGWAIKLSEDEGGRNVAFNNILLGSGTGSIAVGAAARIKSDYNLVLDTFAVEDAGSVITLSAWRERGNDTHSIAYVSSASSSAERADIAAGQPTAAASMHRLPPGTRR